MGIEWKEIFLSDFDWTVALEVVLRTALMFIIALVFLRLTGKKGIRQLSLFEVAIIISLGSAVGDPMFTSEAAIVPSLLVVVTVLLLYRLITWLVSISTRFESIMEGDPLYLIEDGAFVLSEKNQHTFAKDEFLAEMRQQSIEHLGQVRTAILETNGTVSFFYFPDEAVKPGLPTLPKEQSRVATKITEPADYACTYCGGVETLSAVQPCHRCKRKEWVKAMKTVRIA